MALHFSLCRLVLVLAMMSATALSAQSAAACPEIVFDAATGAAQPQADLLEALSAFEDQVVKVDAS